MSFCEVNLFVDNIYVDMFLLDFECLLLSFVIKLRYMVLKKLHRRQGEMLINIY